MTIQIKLVIAAAVLMGAVAYLAGAGMKSGWVYYVDVDQFLNKPEYVTQRVRLHGKVDPIDFRSSPGSLKADFRLAGKERVIRVSYQGQIPDQFQVGRDVVVEGQLANDGSFRADVLLTKCSSKYAAKSPHASKEPA